jgi:hypothetical protein
MVKWHKTGTFEFYQQVSGLHRWDIIIIIIIIIITIIQIKLVFHPLPKAFTDHSTRYKIEQQYSCYFVYVCACVRVCEHARTHFMYLWVNSIKQVFDNCAERNTWFSDE